MHTIAKRLSTLAAGAVLALGAASAQAAPSFWVNAASNGLGGPAAPFQADQMNGISSTRIVTTGGNNIMAKGYINYATFGLSDSPVLGFVSGLNNNYGLYATFTQTFTCSGPLGVGITCAATSITLDLFADAFSDGINTYTGGSIGVDPVVTTAGVQTLLGSSNTVFAGVAGIDALGGAFENINSSFSLTAAGKAFFILPDPFYNLAFSAFNNTSQGVACFPTCAVEAVITQEGGFTDFNRIPEPGSLALIGLGLLAAPLVRRRKS